MSLSYIVDTELWCDRCDVKKVHSNKPETGKFMSKEGHLWDFDKDSLEETFTTIVYAICMDCLE